MKQLPHRQLGMTLVELLVGLAIGYYILCCIRPEQYNFLNLPVPFGSSDSQEAEPAEP